MAGKGDKPRPVDKKKYDSNWDKIFRCKKTSLKKKGTNGNKRTTSR